MESLTYRWIEKNLLCIQSCALCDILHYGKRLKHPATWNASPFSHQVWLKNIVELISQILIYIYIYNTSYSVHRWILVKRFNNIAVISHERYSDFRSPVTRVFAQLFVLANIKDTKKNILLALYEGNPSMNSPHQRGQQWEKRFNVMTSLWM